MFYVYFFSFSGLLSAAVAWPLLQEVVFLVAGILLNILALAYWYRVVRVQIGEQS